MSGDLSQFSTTPASNDLAQFFQTGMRPSKVKNGAWQIMACMAQLFNSKNTASGTNTITLTNPVPFGSLTDGLLCIFRPANANTGAVTFAPDGLTAHAINAYGSALTGGELSTSQDAWVKYDLSTTTWNLINPARQPGYAVASGTNTITATVGGLTAYYDGLRVRLKIANTSTASVTIALNGLTALNVYLGDLVTRDVAGMFVQNQIAELVYNSSLNSSAGGFQFINPSRVNGSATITGTGFTSSPTCTGSYSFEGWIAQVTFGTGLTGTSNSTSFTLTGLPSFLAPASLAAQSFYTCAEDAGGAVGPITISVASGASTFTLGNSTRLGASLGGFTASGTKAFANGSAVAGAGQTFTFRVN